MANRLFGPLPAFLNNVAAESRHDRPISEDEFTALWVWVSPYVEMCVRNTLSKFGLGRAIRYAGRRGQYLQHLATSGAVREVLRAHEARDLVQSVAEAMWRKVQRGTACPCEGLRASVHGVKAWVRSAVIGIVRDGGTDAAVLTFAAGSPDKSAAGEPTYVEPPIEACHETQIQLREAARLMEGVLTARERAVVQAIVLDDLDPRQAATILGYAQGHLRLILHRARAKLRQCVDQRAGPSEEDWIIHNRVDLTCAHMYAIVCSWLGGGLQRTNSSLAEGPWKATIGLCRGRRHYEKLQRSSGLGRVSAWRRYPRRNTAAIRRIPFILPQRSSDGRICFGQS